MRPRLRHLQPAHPLTGGFTFRSGSPLGRQRGRDLGGPERGGPERAPRREVCDRGPDDPGPGPLARRYRAHGATRLDQPDGPGQGPVRTGAHAADGFPGVVLPASDLTLAAGGATPSLTIVTTLADLVRDGRDRREGRCRFRCGSRVCAARRLDVLEDHAPVQAARPAQDGALALAISSFDSEDFTFPGVQGTRLGKGISRGCPRVASSLSLTGLGLGLVAKILHLDQLPLLMTVADTDGRLHGLRGPRPVDQGGSRGVRVRRFRPDILHSTPIEVRSGSRRRSRSMATSAEAQGRRRPFGDEHAGRTETAAPWKDPFWVGGLTITKLAVSMQSEPTPEFNVLGIVTAASNTIEVGCGFTATCRASSRGSSSDLSLVELVHDLVDLTRLPAGPARHLDHAISSCGSSPTRPA